MAQEKTNDKWEKAACNTSEICIKYLHDFIFEREIQEGQTIKTLNSGIKITEKGPEPKKLKAGDQPKTLQLGGPSNQSGSQINNVGSSKGP